MKRSTGPSAHQGVGGPAAARGASVHGIGSTVAPFAEPIGPAGDALEREADRIADIVVRGVSGSARAGWSAAAGSGADETVRQKCVECEEEEEEATIRRAPKDGAAMAQPAREASPAPALLVDDDSVVARGQMRKVEFLTLLRAEVCQTVDEALAGTGRDAKGCPWVDYWLGYYESRGASEIERAMRRYAPESRQSKAAVDYISIAKKRVRRSADIWAKTGQVTGVPEGVQDAPMAGGKAADQFGGMFFKAQPGGPRSADLVSVRDALGDGQAMPGDLRSRMEAAFGTDFANVRLHDDSRGGQISDQLNARAFALGHHIAFAPGEFRPGTIEGDALIAHELAHVVQQGQTQLAEDLQNAGSSTALEHDADEAATRTISRLWTRDTARTGRPRLSSGLRLQRCDNSSSGPIGQQRLGRARANFRKNNKSLGATKLDKIDAALALATKGNINLLIRFYDYYSNEDIEETIPVTSKNLALTDPNSGTRLRKDLLTPGFSDSTLGSTLIHELVHTRHAPNAMGTGDYQEGEAYGVEYVIAARAGDKARTDAIEKIMGNPTQLAMPRLVPSLIQEFKIAFATMTVLYEVIDKGASSKNIPALNTPAPLTADEARAMVAQYIASGSRDKRLNDLLVWIRANLNSFTFPI